MNYILLSDGYDVRCDPEELSACARKSEQLAGNYSCNNPQFKYVALIVDM